MQDHFSKSLLSFTTSVGHESALLKQHHFSLVPATVYQHWVGGSTCCNSSGSPGRTEAPAPCLPVELQWQRIMCGKGKEESFPRGPWTPLREEESFPRGSIGPLEGEPKRS